MDEGSLVDEVRRSLHSPEAEERAHLRQTRILLWGSLGVLPILLAVLVGDWPDMTTWIVVACCAVAAGWAWRRAARPWIVRDEGVVQRLAQASHRCPKCRAIVLPRDGDQCLRCGAFVHPRMVIVVTFLICAGFVAYFVWRLSR